MPLFGFSDITFDKGTPTRKGPLGPLVSSEFERNTLRYPLDIGNFDKGHYMVFYVREQKNTSQSVGPSNLVDDSTIDRTRVESNTFAANSIKGPTPSLQSNFSGEILNNINSGFNKVDSAFGNAISGVGKSLGNIGNNVSGGLNSLFGRKSSFTGGNPETTKSVIDYNIKKITNKNFIQTTKLTTDAIALYMPDTLLYTQSQSYENLTPGTELSGQVLAAGRSAADAQLEGRLASDSIKKSAALGTASFLSRKLGQTGNLAFAALFGAVQNPMLELIYRSPNFRTFQFDFSFFPRDERESLEVQKIIERFRFHQSPELVKDAQGFLIPPSEFDIRFYYGGAQNPNIPQMATCVLTNIEVNYAPNGFSAYEVEGENQPSLGRTGMPVSIQMNLQFQEITYLTKDDYNERSLGIVKNVKDASNMERDN